MIDTPNEWDEVKSLVGQYYGEWRGTEYTGWRSDGVPQTAVLGNGDAGVTSGGDDRVKTFHISKSGMPPIPIGGVTIKPAEDAAITDFYEKQDILNARVDTRLKWGGHAVELRTFLAADGNNLLVIELASKAGADLELRTEAWGRADTGVSSFTLPAGGTVHIVVAIDGAGADADIAGLKAAHAAWWKAFWLRSYIQLDSGDADLMTIQKYYYAAQYVIGCSCSENGVPPGLYGLWHTTDTPRWHSDYHLNYNYISTFYGIFSSNRAEYGKSAMQPFWDYESKAAAAAASTDELRRVNAAHVDRKVAEGKIHPQNGIADALLFPVSIGPSGMEIEAHNYLGQTLDGAFSACLMIGYFEAAHDTALLEEKMIPFMRKIAAFYEAWLDENADGGYTLYAGYNEGSWSANPALELAALKNVLAKLLEYSDPCEAKRPVWRKILDGLAAQPTPLFEGKKVYGLAEREYKNGKWAPMANPVPRDGNIIPLEAVKPCDVLGYYSTPEELQAMRDTIDVFSARGAWGQINNFPKIYQIAVNSRYPIGETIRRFAQTIRAQMKANLLIHDGVHGVEKAGAIAAVNDMLLLKDKGVVTFFPNWPEDRCASFTRLCVGTFEISASYDGAARRMREGAVILSKAGGSITLACPWEDMRVVDAAGKIVPLAAGTAPNHPRTRTYSFETEKGGYYAAYR